MKDKAKEILGADLNQSLHHLIGYWYATDASEVFDTELACAMIDYCLKEVRNPVGKEQQEIESLQKAVIELVEMGENNLNEIATLAWRKQTDMIDPEDLAEWVDRKRTTLQSETVKEAVKLARGGR
jgi:hypothetical protein